MICYFPTIYEDELLYSVIARYYAHIGYLNYIDVAKELYEIPTMMMNMEFVLAFNEEFIDVVERQMDWVEIIKKHTMFPYYARFQSLEKREKAFEALCNQSGNYNNLMQIQKKRNGEERVLRYCPLCAKEDRKKFGETYWHRNHQIVGVNVCPIHKCYLLKSDIVMYIKDVRKLVSAEESCTCNKIVEATNELELRLAQYVIDVFQSKMDMKGNVLIGKFLHSKMQGTKYISIRGEQRNLTLLHKDFMDYYKHLPIEGIKEAWQIEKILNNYRLNPFEICELAMFLDIPTKELVNMKLPLKNQAQLFDEKVKNMHANGMSYVEISKRLDVSYDYIKKIGRGGCKEENPKIKPSKKCGVKPKDWNKIDLETLPKVKEAIRQLQGDGIERPRKVSEYAICKMLGFPNKRFQLLPMCRDEIKKNKESQRQYWIKEIGWAVRKLEREGETLNWKHIRELTNIKRRDFDVCKLEVVELKGIEI